MAKFYLPIKIGQRRMHICHLSNPSVDYGFEFIIPIAGHDIELFSFSHKAKLISTRGARFNREPSRENFKVDYSSCKNDPDSLNVKVLMGTHEGIDDAPLQNEFGISIDRDSDSNFVAKATNLISVKKLNITICYKEQNGESFEYSFAIHTPKVNGQTKIYKTAIDFGSEASQVGSTVYPGNGKTEFIRLVDTLKGFYDDIKHNMFWQGEPHDQLFKSIFFVHKKPVLGYNYAELPNKHQKKTLLQVITPFQTAYTDSESNYYTHLFLLPNLKLVELLAEAPTAYQSVQFNDEENNPRNFKGEVYILSDNLVDDYIRIILSYFLYAILEKLKVETSVEKYLQVTLLMPNVYSQEKVYRIIQNFYKDFNEIVKSKDYNKFKGIEVQAMSESDASFIGARVRNSSVRVEDRIEAIDNAIYLVIDAGKGTTDFSIIKQQGNSNVKYDSLFRAGLPGSGQMLSYAFIESIREMLTGIDLLDMIKSKAEYPEIVEFLKYIEQLKEKHTKFKECQDNNLVNKDFSDLSSLSRVNEYIKSEFIDKEIQIPNSNKKVNQKVQELVDKIEENIRYSGIIEFHQVVLAGRAFLFEPLFEAVKDRLKPLVSAKCKFIFHNSHSKLICIEGAFQAENYHLNLNSELIGSPVVLDQNYNPYSPEKSLIEKIVNRIIPTKSEIFIDESFFYKGMKLNYDLNNKTIRTGARDYSPAVAVIEAAEKSILYYTGDGFVLQWNYGSSELTERRVSESFTKMVEDTVFPFAFINFGNNAPTNSTTDAKPREKAVEEPMALEQPKPTETIQQDSQEKPDSDDDILS